LRARYLFHFSDICGLSPREVDDLWFVDFLQYVDGIQSRLDSREKSAKHGVWIP
jgi:hypothetical protein